jgi:Putative prokaryotic signal transducing protein
VHHFRNVLEAHGIMAVVRNELLSSAMGELPPAECQTELWVPLADAERALAALNAVPEGKPWRCAACGEEIEPQFTQCWRCGAYRSA